MKSNVVWKPKKESVCYQFCKEQSKSKLYYTLKPHHIITIIIKYYYYITGILSAPIKLIAFPLRLKKPFEGEEGRKLEKKDEEEERMKRRRENKRRRRENRRRRRRRRKRV